MQEERKETKRVEVGRKMRRTEGRKKGKSRS